MADRFTVVDQQQTVGRLADGMFGEVVRVKYKAEPTGVVGSVDVPLADYRADVVARMILDRVDVHDEVAGL